MCAQSSTSVDLGVSNLQIDLPQNPLPGGSLTRENSILGSTNQSVPGRVLSSRSRFTTNVTPDLPLQTDANALPSLNSNQSPIVGEGVLAQSDESNVLFNEADFETPTARPTDAPIYEGVVESTLYQTNTVIGLSALDFRRNNGEDRLLSTSGEGGLSTGDATHGDFGGFEAYIRCRASTGIGWEFNYFGFDPSSNTVTVADGPSPVLVGLNNIAQAPGDPTVADIFSSANFNSLTRRSNIYNLEFNVLRNRPNVSLFNGWLGNIETLAGIRYINFDESLEFAAGSDSGVGPSQVEFDSSVENFLIGAQFGGRSEFNLYGKLGATIGTKFGLFYTDANSSRSISGNFANGAPFNPSIINGTTSISGFDFNDSEDDASFLAEFDIGLVYQFARSSRLRFGYRTIGISGLAFASNNIPDDVSDVTQLQQTTDSQNLRLRGTYFSFEYAF